MNSQWNEKNLNELYEFSSGLSKPAEEFGFGFPFLSFKTIFYNYYIDGDLDELVNSTKTEQKTHSIKKGDVFLTRTSETLDELGMSCVALKNYPKATFNGFTKRLRPKHENIIYPLYACYYFRSPLFRKYVDSMAIMTTRASLNNNILSKLPIFFPSYEEQKKISYLLHNLSLKIELNKKINNHLLKLSRSLFKEFYMDRVDSYDVKKYVTLDDVTSKFATGLNPRKNFVLGEGNNYYVTIKNMSNNTIILDDKCASITDEALVKINKRSDLQVGDLLFSGIGTIGRVHLIDEKPTNWNISESVFTIRPNELISSEFLFILLLSKEVQEYAQSLASGSVQKGIRMRDLKAFEFILANEEDKLLLDSLLIPIIAHIKSNEKEIRKLTKLRDTLLPKLMSGEIDISKVNYDLKKIIRKFILSFLNYLWRQLYENKNYFKNTKSNETLLEPRPIHKINKLFTKFIRRYRYNRQQY